MQIDRTNLAGVLASLPGSGTRPTNGESSTTPDHSMPSPARSQPPVGTTLQTPVPKGTTTGETPPTDNSQTRPPSPGAALAGLDRAVTAVLAVDPAATTDTAALETLEELARQRRRLEAAWLQAVAVADQLDAVSAFGTPATLQQHLISGTGSAPGRAKADIEAARALHGEPTRELIRTPTTGTGPLAPMGELLAGGSISTAHIDTGVKTLEQVPHRLSTDENLARIIGFLTDQAPATTPKQIKTLANRLIRNLEPDTDDHYDADAYLRRSFTINTDITGMVHGSYQLDPAAGAELVAILNPLAAPHPAQKDENGNTIARDQRTPAQRNADAFNELIRAAATHLGPVNHSTSPPTGHDDGPRAAGNGQNGSSRRNGNEAPAEIPDLFTLFPTNRPQNSGSDPSANQPSGHHDTQQGPDGQTQHPPSKHNGTQQPPEGQTQQSPTGQTHHLPGGKAQQSSGSRAGKLRLSRRQNRVSIVTTMDQIKTLKDRRTGQHRPLDPVDSYCEQTGPLPTGALARMSCDALFERVVLDAKGALLDLGLPTRLASPAQRRAVAIRDGGCFGPGCNRPAGWCELHHVIWYSHDGPTDIGNLAPGCPSHHSAVHAGLLEVTMIDGIPYVRVTSKGAKTYGTTTPLGTIAHPEHSSWIRNSYFDQLKAADHAARAITLPETTQNWQQWAA